MAFNSEKEFEAHIRTLIQENILPLDENLVMMQNKKAVDILVCRNGATPALFFIEIKFHKKSHGRLSTGHGKGGGIQPELIRLQPDYFKSNMRWILGNEDSDGYWIINNATVLNYIAGNSIGIKFNNIQNKIFRELPPASKSELIDTLRSWILLPPAGAG